MSQFATSPAPETYRHAPWCKAETTVEYDDCGEPHTRCTADETGTCSLDPGGISTIIMSAQGQTLVWAEVPRDPMTPNEMLAIAIELLTTAHLAGATVAA